MAARRLLRLTALWALLLLAAGFRQAELPAAREGDPQAVVDEGLRIVYWPGHRALAERTLEAARAPLPLPGLPSDTVFTDGTIYLAPSPLVFDSLTGNRAPDWAAGVAFPALRVIVLPVFSGRRTPNRDPVVTLRHELAHLALNAYLPQRIPRWFDEGYATWVSGSLDEAGAWRLRWAFLLGRAPPLDSLTLDWPAAAAEAEMAYLLSASAVRYLAELGGERGFTALLEVWREEGSLETAIRRVYGMTLGQFETDWRRMVRRRYGWLLMFSQITLFWLMTAVVVLGLFAIRRRRNRERMRQLELHDRTMPAPPGLPPEYWMMEDPGPVPAAPPGATPEDAAGNAPDAPPYPARPDGPPGELPGNGTPRPAPGEREVDEDSWRK